ncbi:hypothetical protein GALMADRAFT_214658 [Galerina marginata CBS 339.88]|uniref:Uncharacterized protein n=1 Tax=Galerina marginata (strain CBS 339.88) TaxID=685588 RepID=A0A067SGY5_GALM3|nr:hypothetical protein GALMADRAFT_214658 [Galerina marginata CBS 339.88]
MTCSALFRAQSFKLSLIRIRIELRRTGTEYCWQLKDVWHGDTEPQHRSTVSSSRCVMDSECDWGRPDGADPYLESAGSSIRYSSPQISNESGFMDPEMDPRGKKRRHVMALPQNLEPDRHESAAHRKRPRNSGAPGTNFIRAGSSSTSTASIHSSGARSYRPSDASSSPPSSSAFCSSPPTSSPALQIVSNEPIYAPRPFEQHINLHSPPSILSSEPPTRSSSWAPVVYYHPSDPQYPSAPEPQLYQQQDPHSRDVYPSPCTPPYPYSSDHSEREMRLNLDYRSSSVPAASSEPASPTWPMERSTFSHVIEHNAEVLLNLLAQELKEAQSKHQEQISSLRLTHQAEISTSQVNLELALRLKEEAADALAQELKETRSKHQDQISSLLVTHQVEVVRFERALREKEAEVQNRLNAVHASVLALERQEAEEILRRTTQTHVQELGALEMILREAHQAKMESMAVRYTEAVADTQAKLADATKKAEECGAHARAVEERLREVEARLVDANRTHEREMARLRTDQERWKAENDVEMRRQLEEQKRLLERSTEGAGKKRLRDNDEAARKRLLERYAEEERQRLAAMERLQLVIDDCIGEVDPYEVAKDLAREQRKFARNTRRD